MKLAAAGADFTRQYGAVPPEVLDIVRRVAIRKLDLDEEQEATCPSCSSPGVATGAYDVEWTGERDRASAPVGAVWFTADSFECPTCRLHLEQYQEQG